MTSSVRDVGPSLEALAESLRRLRLFLAAMLQRDPCLPLAIVDRGVRGLGCGGCSGLGLVYFMKPPHSISCSLCQNSCVQN